MLSTEPGFEPITGGELVPYFGGAEMAVTNASAKKGDRRERGGPRKFGRLNYATGIAARRAR